jgi:hypothetical protein
METVLKAIVTLSKGKTKKKVLNIQVPTEKFSDVLLYNVNRAFRQYDLGNPEDYEVHIFIEKGMGKEDE